LSRSRQKRRRRFPMQSLLDDFEAGLVALSDRQQVSEKHRVVESRHMQVSARPVKSDDESPTVMLPAEVTALVLSYASGHWPHRRVAREWASSIAFAFLRVIHTVPLNANEQSRSSIFYHTSLLSLKPGIDGIGTCEVNLWREAGEPYGPISDLLATWSGAWHLKVDSLQIVMKDWIRLPKRNAGEDNVVDSFDQQLLPQTISLKELLTCQRQCPKFAKVHEPSCTSTTQRLLVTHQLYINCGCVPHKPQRMRMRAQSW